MSTCFPAGKAKLPSLSASWEFSKSTWIIQEGFDLSVDGHRHKLFPEPAGKQYSWHFSPPASSRWYPILGQQLSQLPLYWQLSDMFGVSGDPTASLCYSFTTREEWWDMRLHTAAQVSFQGWMRLSLGRKGQYVHFTAWLKLPLIQRLKSLQGMLGVCFWDSWSRGRCFVCSHERRWWKELLPSLCGLPVTPFLFQVILHLDQALFSLSRVHPDLKKIICDIHPSNQEKNLVLYC